MSEITNIIHAPILKGIYMINKPIASNGSREIHKLFFDLYVTTFNLGCYINKY